MPDDQFTHVDGGENLGVARRLESGWGGKRRRGIGWWKMGIPKQDTGVVSYVSDEGAG